MTKPHGEMWMLPSFNRYRLKKKKKVIIIKFKINFIVAKDEAAELT
jgi:hypothetical protein